MDANIFEAMAPSQVVHPIEDPGSSDPTRADSSHETALPISDLTAVEALVEDDASLVPSRPSVLLVEPNVLDAQEIAALLTGLGPLLEATATQVTEEETHYESHAPSS